MYVFGSVRIGFRAVSAVLGTDRVHSIPIAISQSCVAVLEAVRAVCNPNTTAIYASIGAQLRGHPDWKRLTGNFWEGVVLESSLGPDLDARLQSVRRDGALSPDWLNACHILVSCSGLLRKGRTEALEAEMVRAIASLDAGLLLSPACPEAAQADQHVALDAAKEALAKLAALENAIGKARADLGQVRRNMEARLGSASQGVLCGKAVRALTAAAADASVERLTAAADSLRAARGMASALTENMLAALQAAVRKLRVIMFDLPLDCPASFQLGYRAVEVQELADLLAGRDDDGAALAKAILQAQRAAMQTWEATEALELAAAPTMFGGMNLSDQQLPASWLAKCLAEWTNVSNAAAPPQPAHAGHAGINPDEALPAACEAGVFIRGVAALDAYYGKILGFTLDRLQSATLALEYVASGDDDCTSWKRQLASNASFEDVTEAAQVLIQNTPNFAKPFFDLKKAGTCRGCRLEFQHCVRADKHVNTSQPHSAHSNM